MRLFLVVVTTLGLATGCSSKTTAPDPFAGLQTHADRTELRHLAEVRDGGW